ncbi:MAG: HAMP domain-containing histidine kinase [Chloroflexi bacterium]|nr:HAMP domain-containing histidine kinase [Chloroflexota bacterium]
MEDHDVLQQRVLGDLPGGAFRLDKEGRVTWVSAEAAQVWCPRIGQFWYETCFDPEAARAWFQSLRPGTEPVRKTFLMRRCSRDQDPSPYFWAWVYLAPDRDQGWRGFLVDRTSTEVVRRLQRVPAGFYIAQRDAKGKDRLVYATPGFARLYREGAADARLEPSVDRWFPDAGAYQRFTQTLRARPTHAALLGWPTEARTAQGDPLPVAADLAWQVDAQGEVVEHYGVVRDLRQSELFSSCLRDYALLVHACTNALSDARHALSTLKVPMLSDPFQEQTPARLWEWDEAFLRQELRRTRQPMLRALRALLRQAEERHLESIHLDHLRRYAEHLQQLHEEEEKHAPAVIAAAQVRIGSRILFRLQKLREERPRRGPWFSRDLLRGLRVVAWDMVRTAALMVIYPTEAQLLSLEPECQLFRAFWDARGQAYQRQPTLLTDALDEAMQGMADFAQARGVAWSLQEPWPREAKVYADPDALRRAFGHLLHNAVKYTWPLSKSTPPIELRLIYQERAGQPGWTFEMRHYGVPIEPDELAQGRIFELGYRGRWARKLYPFGTGIGLYDARRIITAFEGALQLESTPALTWPGTAPLRPLAASDEEGETPRPHQVSTRVWLPLWAGARASARVQHRAAPERQRSPR